MDTVRVRQYKLTLPTYESPKAQELPMFAENRVHQRSTGNPYPNRVVLEVQREKREDQEYDCLCIENRYLKIEILPALGGRIYSAQDKTTGYDFFYKQHVIKPALIGMLGNWISGGCEFNWPCHHRPSTFMPVDWHVEESRDGSATVWLSEHDPVYRMKGMVGIRLEPDAAVFDTVMKVYNRTPLRHPFLWWENVAVPVNEQYQLFFPPDVHYVQFHYRKNITTFPVASGVFNGLRMGEGTDISFHKNTRNPTSYFCAGSRYGFFGGYDYSKGCGVVHVADPHTSIGKKMFTWGYKQLAESWERALTDDDGPYAELMASSYSANQPDFAWLEGYEHKEFTQSWYPLASLGAPLCATRYAAAAQSENSLRVQVTAPLEGAVLRVNGREHPFSAMPGTVEEIAISGRIRDLTLTGADGRVLLYYSQEPAKLREIPDTLPDNQPLNRLKTAYDCYLAGVHVEQYRDPLILPDAYYREAIAREPDFAPALTSLARFCYERGKLSEARSYADRAWRAVTVRNFHPESGEAAYVLGLICEAEGKDEEAVHWYGQAAWQQDARSRAMTRASFVYGRQGQIHAMLEAAREALLAHPKNETAACLKAAALKRLGQEEAGDALAAVLKADPLFHLARSILDRDSYYESLHSDPAQTTIDVAADLWDMGEDALARELLKRLEQKSPMSEYLRFYFGGKEALSSAPKHPLGSAYPSRLVELRALEAAIREDSRDVLAKDLLACALYDKGNAEQAAELWREAARLDPKAYRPLRNLAVASYTHLGKREDALPLLQQARAARPGDTQLVFESAYVMQQMNRPAREIAAFLEAQRPASLRDDTRVEWARCLSVDGRYEEALELLLRHPFIPCEGGETNVAEQYMFARHGLGRKHLAAGRIEQAYESFRAAQELPASLGAGFWHEALLAPHRFYEALCLDALGRGDEARAIWAEIIRLRVDYFSDMYLPELPCWQAKAMLETGLAAPAESLLAAHARRYQSERLCRDAGWFKATPFFLSYVERPERLRQASCDYQLAMAHWAAGDLSEARVLAQRAFEGNPLLVYTQLILAEIQ